MSRTHALAALASVLSVVALAGQQAPPAARPADPIRPDPQMPPITFRSEVNYVEVDASVRDAQGTFVRDLRQEDFQVLEDGVPQTVTAFSLIDIPVALSERPLFLPQDVEPDVRSNESAPEGRLYVLMLDDLHTGPTRTNQVRRAARQFIERNLGANDLAAVIESSGRSDAAQDFTNSRRLLTQAVDKFMGQKLRSAALNRIDYYNWSRQTGQPGAPMDPEQAERFYKAQSMMRTLRNVADWLAGVRGRKKALVLFGEGIDYNIWGQPLAGSMMTGVDSTRNDGSALMSEMQDAIAAATRANVAIYAIDPRGLATAGEEGMEVTGLPPEAEASGLGMVALQEELRMAQDSLRVLAEETGGFASLTSNDFSGAFRRIVDENSSYYVLGYYSNNEKRDGRFRRITVRLSRPGLTVNARKGYAAPRGKPQAESKLGASAGTSKELRETLNSPLQTTALKFAVFAAPLKGPGQKAAIAVVTQFAGRELAFAEKGGKYACALEMSYIAVDKQGKVATGQRDMVNLALRPDTYRRVAESGFRVLTRLELAPGTYQLRVAAREDGGKVGSVHYDLMVPDFAKGPIGISGLIVASAASSGAPTAGAIPEIGDALKAPPTTARTFSSSDELAVLAEVYDNQAAQAHSVDITTTLKAEGRVPVFSNTEQRSSKELGGAKGGYGHLVRIPLKGAAPGLYLLTVSARSTLGVATAATREVQIRIVP